MPALAILALAALAPLPATAQTTTAAPPVAERRAHVDTLHGEVRSDDYFWLRVKSDPAVRAYLEAENAYAEAVLAPLASLREELYAEMLGRIKQTDLSVPYRDNGWFYYTRTEEGKQYPIFARREGSLDAPEQVVLDVNALAEGQEFMAVGAFSPSDDAHLLAYSTDSTGFRQYVLHVKDLRTGELMPTRAERVRSVAWAADNRTLFYTVEDSITKRPHQLYRHVLGSPVHELIYEEPDERFSMYVGRTNSDEFLLLAIGSLTTSEVRFLPADQPDGEWRQVAARV